MASYKIRLLNAPGGPRFFDVVLKDFTETGSVLPSKRDVVLTRREILDLNPELEGRLAVVREIPKKGPRDAV